MARIAVVDLVFHWPPMGGSMVNVREILTRVARHHEVRLFVPHMPRYYPRGVIEQDPGFPVDVIPCEWLQFRPSYLAAEIRKRVDKFKPDLVWVADGWTMKPYIIKALAHHRLWHIFFAYEMLCPIGNERFHFGKRCLNSTLVNPLVCAAEVACQLAVHMGRRRLTCVSHESLASAAFRPWYGALVRKALSLCRRHLVYGTHYHKLLKSVDAPVYVVPGGVDIRHFVPKAVQRDKVLMLGRVDDRAKGLNVLLRALNIVRQDGLEASLAVTGNGHFGPGVEALGWTSYADVPSLYQSASVVVVPSLWEEPFGLVAAEAAACGVPVIASRNGSLPSIVKDGETGFLVTPGDERELAARLRILLRNPQLRDRLGLAARAHAEKVLDWDRIVEDHHLPMIDEDV